MSNNGNHQQQTIFEEIMLHKPPALRIEHARIPVEKVAFDQANPRLKYLKERFKDKTDAALLFENPDTPWLKRDIAEKGVLDPIYVKLKDDCSYVVVEGNRRTAVMQELHKEHPENPSYFKIPARILPGHTTDEQEALLMASFHVAGKVKWDAHEKAGHIWHMQKVLRIPEAEMANTLHMAVPTIKRTAESFDLLEQFKRIDGGKYADQAAGKWSFFSEMLKIKEFRERHEKGQDWADQFARWVGDKRIPRAEDVRDLPLILKKAAARNLLENHTPAEEAFEKARREVDRSNPGRSSKFFKELEKVIAMGKSANLADLDAASSNDVARDTVIEAYQVIAAFMEKAGVRVPGTPRRVA